MTLAQRNTRAANAAHRSRRSERAEKAAAARDGGAAGANRCPARFVINALSALGMHTWGLALLCV